MTGSWDNEERAREWPVESLSAWAAAVVGHVEQSGGDGEAAYCSLYEFADTLGMWDDAPARGPGHVWTDAEVREVRRRVAHLLDAMRRAVALLPQHPAWITLQLVDLLDTSSGLPTLSAREVDRRTRYFALHRSSGRIVRTQFDLDIGACEPDDPWDHRRPETADEHPVELLAADVTRPRTLAELADDLREEATRASFPERAIEKVREAAALAQQFRTEAASSLLEQVLEILYEEIAALGDFRTRLLD